MQAGLRLSELGPMLSLGLLVLQLTDDSRELYDLVVDRIHLIFVFK